ncbi:hypothetical protein L1887_29711 [Cichorium endivia]|nr:hypothetical protein L1887_29711 [Cichorium endivia]
MDGTMSVVLPNYNHKHYLIRTWFSIWVIGSTPHLKQANHRATPLQAILLDGLLDPMVLRSRLLASRTV